MVNVINVDSSWVNTMRLRPGFLRTVENNAKREGLPLLQEWAKKPRTVGETVPFMMALEKKLIDKDTICKDLKRSSKNNTKKNAARNQKVKDQALDIEILRGDLQDVAAYTYNIGNQYT